MEKSIERTNYKAFGLTIASDFELPELQSVNNDFLSDVDIIKTDLSSEWSALTDEESGFIVSPEYVMFQMRDIAIYLIKNGNEILVSPLPGSEEDQIRLYLLGTCMGTILFQRKILPLHGSAIVVDGSAYALVGDSGAGKSTLASAFLNRGYQLLSDDVIPVTISDEGVPLVTPAYPQQKLWLESLKQFGWSSDQLRPIVGREKKFAVPVSDQFENKQITLAGVIELSKRENDKVELQPIKSLARFHKLYLHTYRNFFLGQMDLVNWHFNSTAKIINSIKMYHLQRPLSRFTADELVDVLLPKMKKKERVQ